MGGTVWHCHIAVSLDGRIARPDGSVDDWLAADYPAADFGFEDFLAGVDAILMGRGTYDAARRFGDWPYPGKPTVVLTTRPLDDPRRRPAWRLAPATWPLWPPRSRGGDAAASGSRAAAKSSGP
jgi:dihydrofolate reductase